VTSLPVPAAPTAPAFPRPSPFAAHWKIDPSVVFLNHGSFGALPRTISQRQREIQDLLYAEPVRFYVELFEPMLDKARHDVAPFLGCPADDFCFVHNATMGVNTVLRSLRLDPGDEIITSAQEYNACNNVLRWAETQWGAKAVFAPVPFPLKSADEVVDAFVAAVTPRTRLVMVSHITSPTAIILPVDRIVAEMARRGIDTLVDGAHAPGMLPLDIANLGGPPGPAYYTGNFHKWCCAPNGAAFLYVRPDRQHLVRPTVISHGANAKRTDRSRFRLEMDYLGTMDYSSWLCVPDALRFNASLLPGGWDELRRRNRQLALDARDLLCNALGAEPPAPDDMIGTMACVRLPDRTPAESALTTKYHDPLQDALIARHRIQVPIIPFPAAPTRYVRVSANMYNTMEQYEYLAGALKSELGRAR
jgi:isopenicillin-N epimerase